MQMRTQFVDQRIDAMEAESVYSLCKCVHDVQLLAVDRQLAVCWST